MRATLALLSSLAFADSGHAFEVDRSGPELRAVLKVKTIADLAPGEEGITTSPNLCIRGGKLYTLGPQRVSSDLLDFTYNWKAIRRPDGAVGFRLIAGAEVTADRTARDEMLTALVSALERPCDRSFFDPQSIIAVSDIDGWESLSAAMK